MSYHLRSYRSDSEVDGRPARSDAAPFPDTCKAFYAPRGELEGSIRRRRGVRAAIVRAQALYSRGTYNDRRGAITSSIMNPNLYANPVKPIESAAFRPLFGRDSRGESPKPATGYASTTIDRTKPALTASAGSSIVATGRSISTLSAGFPGGRRIIPATDPAIKC